MIWATTLSAAKAGVLEKPKGELAAIAAAAPPFNTCRRLACIAIS